MKDAATTAWCVAGLAGVAALTDKPGQAAWLWSASEALRVAVKAREAPAGRPAHAALQSAVRARMGEAAFAAAWEAGRLATHEQIMALVEDRSSVA